MEILAETCADAVQGYRIDTWIGVCQTETNNLRIIRFGNYMKI